MKNILVICLIVTFLMGVIGVSAQPNVFLPINSQLSAEGTSSTVYWCKGHLALNVPNRSFCLTPDGYRWLGKLTASFWYTSEWDLCVNWTSSELSGNTKFSENVWVQKESGILCSVELTEVNENFVTPRLFFDSSNHLNVLSESPYTGPPHISDTNYYGKYTVAPVSIFVRVPVIIAPSQNPYP
jgi:hypothetical protein